VAPNLLNRQLMVAAPNRTWVADIAAIWTLEGWLYLATVLGLHDRQLVGSAMADQMRTQLVLDALDMAVGRWQADRGLIHHSDRGCQHASHESCDTMARHGFQALMSRKGKLLGQRRHGALLRLTEKPVAGGPAVCEPTGGTWSTTSRCSTTAAGSNQPWATRRRGIELAAAV